MTDSHYIPLTDRGLIRIEGDIRADFLQGLITRNIAAVNEEYAIYCCLLSPQGKYLFDFFVIAFDNSFYLDCALSLKEDLLKTLKRYKLRSPITLTDVTEDFDIAALMGDEINHNITENTTGKTYPFCEGIAYRDPRSLELGARAIIKKDNHFKSFEARKFVLGDISHYHKKRIELMIPEGEKDFLHNDAYPLQWHLDDINAFDFDKGCYVGQEVTIRTKHKGSIRQKVLKLRIPLSLHTTAGDIITLDDKKVGKIGSQFEEYALALIEFEKLPANTKNIAAMVNDSTVTIILV